MSINTPLIVTASDRQRILSEPEFSGYLEDTRAQADKYLSSVAGELSFSVFKLFEATGDRLMYEKVYFERRGRLACFGLLAWLYEDEKYVHALEDIIWLILDEYTWALPAHLDGNGLSHIEDDGYMIDLFASETAGALSEIIALNADKLHPMVVARARREIRERVISRYLVTSFNWERLPNNWAAVCAGSVGIASLYSAADDAQKQAVIDKLQPVMDVYLSGFPNDGTSVEGLGYWYYGFSFFVSYADMLCKATDGAINWFGDPRVHAIATFQQKAYIGDELTVAFSDACSKGFNRWWGLTSYLKKLYPDVECPPLTGGLGTFDSDNCYRWVTILRDLVWTDTHFKYKGNNHACYILPDAQWIICNSENVSFAAKAGHNGESHNHNDLGSFEFFKHGEELLMDFGSGVYTRQYFGPERYESMACSSFGHSVPIIEGCPQLPGRERSAADVKFGHWFIDMELASAYDAPGLTSYRRKAGFDPENGVATLNDVFAFSAPCTGLVERFVSFAKPSLDGSGCIRISGKSACCSISYDSSKLKPVLSDYILKDHSGNDILINVIDFIAEPGKDEYDFTFTIA